MASLKHCLLYSLGTCALTVFHHIYRSSHIWPRLKCNLNCPQDAAIEPCWHVHVLKCWNEPGKNSWQPKNIFSCKLSLKILMCWNVSNKGSPLFKECVISCDHLLKYSWLVLWSQEEMSLRRTHLSSLLRQGFGKWVTAVWLDPCRMQRIHKVLCTCLASLRFVIPGVRINLGHDGRKKLLWLHGDGSTS